MTWTDIITPMLIPFVMSILLLAMALSLRLLWLLPLTLSAAYVATHTALTKFPPFPPISADEWLPYTAIVAAPLALLDRFVPKRRIVAPLLWGGLLLTHFWLAIGTRKGPLFVAFLALAIASAISLATTFRAPKKERPLPTASALLTMIAASTSAAAILLLGASLRLAMLAMSLTIFAIATAIVSATLLAIKKQPHHLHIERLFPLYFTLLCGLFTSGVLFAKAPLPSAILTIIAMTAGFYLRHRSQLLATLIALLLCAAATGFAYYDLKIATPPPPPQDHYDPYSW